MKMKLTLLLAGLMMAVAANAQFEKGKKYIGASLSGLNMSYNGSEKSHFGLDAKAGYFFTEDWMVTGQVGYDKKTDIPAALSIGVGARYYIVKI
ncbi:MAG: outer membrane beta-barrel protein [Prevotella sp.]|nr:outer membrane beta-barrel protein [Prevotella sp.]